MVSSCEYDCWDRGGGLSAFTAVLISPAAGLGWLLIALRQPAGGTRALSLAEAAVYALIGGVYLLGASFLGALCVGVAGLCATAFALLR